MLAEFWSGYLTFALDFGRIVESLEQNHRRLRSGTRRGDRCARGGSMSLTSVKGERVHFRIVPMRAGLDLDFKELWEYRELLYFLIWKDVKVRYKQTVLGAGWAIIQPFFTMIVFSLFFGLLAKLPSQDLPYPIFYYSALLPWLYVAGALQEGTNTMTANRSVITRVYFPRLILPLASVLSPLVDFAVAFTLLVAMMLFYGLTPGPVVLLLPVFLLVAVVTALAVGLWLAALNAVYRDIRYVVPFLIQLWMFASPVVYPSSLVPEAWRWVYGLNPMAGVIEGFRWALLGQGKPSLPLGASIVSVILVLVGGLFYFRRVEGTIVDLV
jgi:lipopolysaccharide transport system permease protein